MSWSPECNAVKVDLFASFRKLRNISRSFRHSWLIFTERLLLAVVCRSLRWLMKWWIRGMVRPRWMRRPMLALISFAVKASSLIIFLMASDHAMNLFSGRQIKSWQKLISHPRITFCSLRRASDCSLFLASIVSQGIGLFSCSGHEHVSNARRGMQSHRTRLSVPSTSTVREMSVDVVIGCALWVDVNFNNPPEAFLEGGQGVDLFQTASLGPNYCCILLQLWEHRWFLILHSICTGRGLHQRWVEGSSLQVLALGVALLFLLRFCCEGGGFNMLTWSHPPLPWFVN